MEQLSIKLKPAKNKQKKFKAQWIDENKKKHTISFGQKEYGDFTINKDEQKRDRYIIRHKKREQQYWEMDKKNLIHPSFWSRYLLWEKPTLQEAIDNLEQNLQIKIEYNPVEDSQ